ncbi:hypothetical protein BGX27_006848 [Mortierella sp. AM989]|nr:hypothetical protein BGX27_006848 [Mortierella sp. AM989]
MGAVSSSLQQSTDWVRIQGSNFASGGNNRSRREGDSSRRRREQRRQRRAERDNRVHGDVEARGEEYFSDDDEDYNSLDDGDDENDDDDSLLEEEGSMPGQAANDNHPLYFGPAFHPVIEQSPAQLQLQRQIEQQLEQQQRQEYWQQQYRQQQQQQQHQQHQQLSPLSTAGGQQLSLNDFILPSAISGLSGVSAGGGVQNGGGGGGGTGPGSPILPSPSNMPTTESAQDQLYRNSNLYNLISGLNVNALLTEVQRAGTLDLSVLEQELDDVEGGWMDIDDEDEQAGHQNMNNDTDIDYGYEGIVREMQPTKRSPTALACSINLKKSTLRLVKNSSVSNDPSIPAPSHLRPNYRLDFSFDSLTPCDVKLFWVVKEVEENGELGFRLRRLHHLPQPTTYHFPAGMNQRFVSPILPLYTMSLPELTMQGLPSTSMRIFQKKNQKQWQQFNSADKGNGDDEEEWDDEDDNDVASGRGRKSKNKNKNKNKAGKNGTQGPAFNEGYYKKFAGRQLKVEDDEYKHIMEDQYFPLVVLIESTKEYKATAPARSLPTPVADSPGLYLVDNQAISTFACFNISSEGGFEIKVMKQKVWVNSTNYLVQEIYGFTDSVTSPTPPNTGNGAKKSTMSLQSNTKAHQSKHQDKRLSRTMSRLSRAESIASRVDELTMDRFKIRKPHAASSQAWGDEQKQEEEKRNRSKAANASLSRKASKASTVLDLNIAEPRNPDEEEDRAQDIQEESDDQDETASKGQQERESGQARKEEEEANLVLLDAPECVICLSDVKDTIVLPCRHFCICSECGDILRRRSPQRCPICRQVFQALLHIASTPTRTPDFATVTSPASVQATALQAPTEVLASGSGGGDDSMRF